jgi:putative addiction module component (TIGR02574 family)
MLNDSLNQVEEQALRLSVRDRARLAHRLLESLDEAASEDPAEVERAWKEEIERRVADFDAGGIELIPSDEVLREAHAKLRRT